MNIRLGGGQHVDAQFVHDILKGWIDPDPARQRAAGQQFEAIAEKHGYEPFLYQYVAADDLDTLLQILEIERRFCAANWCTTTMVCELVEALVNLGDPRAILPLLRSAITCWDLTCSIPPQTFRRFDPQTAVPYLEALEQTAPEQDRQLISQALDLVRDPQQSDPPSPAGKASRIASKLRYKLIVNPIAGRGTGERAIPHIEQMLSGYDLDFDLVRTEAPWHAADLAQEAVAAGYDGVVAVGGDGTANEVLNGLMRARQAGAGTCPMGILCVGRGNDFAYGVGVPTNLEAGCQALAQGRRRTMDVGRVVGGLYPEGRYFGNGVGIGFDAVVGFEAVKMTRLHGFPSYLVAVLKTVFLYYKAPLVTIEYDGQTIKQPSLMISIMNGQRMGGGFLMAPQGQPDDGLFDLCIARQVSRARIFALIPHFLRGTQATQEPIRTGRARRVVITAVEGVLPAHADGETLCTDGQQLELELLPSQIEVISQPPEAVG